MNRREKKAHHCKSHVGSKSFWDACKPFFSEKGVCHEKIILVQNDRIVSDESSIFNIYFSNITSALDIPCWIGNFPQTQSSRIDPIDLAIHKYCSLPSVININSRFGSLPKFDFHQIQKFDMRKKIFTLDASKSTGGDNWWSTS